MTVRACAATGCCTVVGAHASFCGRHWRTLPPRLRRRVWQLCRARDERLPGWRPELEKALDEARRLIGEGT